jgi:phospholipid/cholesterol/gamma-HCH transport system ATP-binding protein
MDAPPRTPSAAATPVDKASAVQFDNVWLGFNEGPILKGVSFSVRPEETLILLGETGTGKTLTLKLAAGLLSPDQGTVYALGEDLSTKSEQELLQFRRQVGFVFQEGALFDSLTVGENVAYRLEEEGASDDVIKPRVQEVLKFVELEHTMEMLPSDLSGGMRRRVAIARALAARPPVVLYDSPTAGLDPITSQTIITLILRLRDVYGVTAVMATHRLQDGFGLSNFHFDPKTHTVRRGAAPEGAKPRVTRFLVLRDGHIYFEGSPDEMLKTKDSYLQRFLI